jgi:ABC-type amino acid transport substrate-binding protein
VLLTVSGLSPLYARTLRISGTEWPPYFYYEAGTSKGLFSEFYAELKKRTGIDFQIITMPQKRMLQSFREGAVDAESFTNPAWRIADNDISAYTIPIMESVDVVLMLKNRMIHGRSSADFYGMTLGCNLGYFYGEGFKDGFESKKIIRDDAVGVEASIKKLKLGRVDAIILDRLEAAYAIKRLNFDPDIFGIAYTFRNISPLSMRIHTSKADLVPKLDSAIKSMKDDGFVAKLLNAYLK